MPCIGFQEIEGSVGGFLRLAITAKAGLIKLAAAGQHLTFQTERADHAGLAARNRV